MNCLDRFNKKMKLHGSSIREANIKYSQELIRETFADDASFSLGIYFWELGIKEYDHKETVPIRIFKRTFSNANGVTMKFQTLNDMPIVVGDILYDSKDSSYLICTESFNIDSIHYQGKLTLCNWILKWQDKKGRILEYPCHDINATQYNSGERGNEQFTVGSSQHLLVLPCDENTVALNTPQRFFLDKNMINPTSYIVTQNDTTSYNYGAKGLVRVTVMQCPTNNATDRFDLGVCDYVDYDVIKPNNECNKVNAKSTITYDTRVIKSGGDPQRFVGKFFDENGREITGIEPAWTITSDFNDALEVEMSDNWIEISIDNDDYIDEELKLALSDNDGNYPSSLIIRIESLL